MSQSIQFKRGNKANLPNLDNGEPALVSDDKDLYIGTPSGNQLIGGQTVLSQLAENAKDLEERSINIKTAGAKGDYDPETGSGADDTLVIQQILNSLNAGDSLIVTKGNYKVGELTVPDGVTVKFTAKGKFYATSGTKVLILGSDCIVKTPKIIETRSYSSMPNTTQGIAISGKRNIEIFGGTIEGFTFTNIKIDNASKNVKVSKVTLKNAGVRDTGTGGWEGQGIYVGGTSENVIITENFVYDNGKHGIQAWSNGSIIAAKGLTITNNQCYNNGDTGIALTNIQDFTISNNITKNNGVNGGPYGGQGIQLVGNSNNETTCAFGTISANKADFNLENGIEFISNVQEVTLVGNQCRKNTWSGIKVEASGHIALTGNVCNSNDEHGIRVLNTNSANLSGNITNSNKQHGTVLGTCADSNIVGFTALNNGLSVSQRSGVEVSGGTNNGVHNGTAKDNQTTATQEYGVRFYNVTGGSITGVRGSGNKTKLVLVDGTSTGVTRDNPNNTDVQYGGFQDVNGIKYISGSGIPENVIVANPGSIFNRTDGATGSCLYVKETGTGSTGWRRIGQATTVNNSTATDISGVNTKINEILTALKDAKLMA